MCKSDDAFVFYNHRPVSLLCVISKAVKNVMYNRLIVLLETFAILNNSQFGVSTMHSTYMALITFMDGSITSLGNVELVPDIYLDFSKDFDTEDHMIILKKLVYYGIRRIVLKSFESCLSNRENYVTYRDPHMVVCYFLFTSMMPASSVSIIVQYIIIICP